MTSVEEKVIAGPPGDSDQRLRDNQWTSASDETQNTRNRKPISGSEKDSKDHQMTPTEEKNYEAPR